MMDAFKTIVLFDHPRRAEETKENYEKDDGDTKIVSHSSRSIDEERRSNDSNKI